MPREAPRTAPATAQDDPRRHQIPIRLSQPVGPFDETIIIIIIIIIIITIILLLLLSLLFYYYYFNNNYYSIEQGTAPCQSVT